MRPLTLPLALLLCAAGALAPAVPGALAQDAAATSSAEGGTAPAEATAEAEAEAAAEEPGTGPLDLWEADRSAPLDAAGVDLDAFGFVARPFVVFADSPRDPRLADQLRLLATDQGSLAGRDVAVIVDSDPDARSAVRRALRPRGFDVVLIDKDGAVLLRRPAPLSAREVARAIDQTPLRREELRRGRAAE